MRSLQSGKELALTLSNRTVKSGAVLLATAAAFTTQAVSAAPDALLNGVTAAQPTNASSNLPDLFQMISNTLIYIVGAVAVVMLIIGGLRYVISNGDPKAVEAAKNTILYAVIGIIVAVLAFAIVNFVISKF